MYSEKVMEHFEHPRNVGEIPDASGTGTVGNAKCGDIMKMDIKVENDVITDVKFKTFGCCAAIATSSMATEMVKGKHIDEALQLTNKAVARRSTACPRSRCTARFWRSRPSTPRWRIIRKSTPRNDPGRRKDGLCQRFMATPRESEKPCWTS